jgi:hypothetical protein
MRAWLSIDTPPVELAQSVGPAQDTPPADGDGQLLRDVEPLDLSDLTDPGTVLDVLGGALENLITGFVARVPLLVLAAVILVIALLLIRVIMRLVDRGLNRERVEFAVQRLISNLLRVSLVTGAVLLALSIAGVQVGAALAAIGLVGLALAFALQNILENFVAGMLILVRKPFGRGTRSRPTTTAARSRTSTCGSPGCGSSTASWCWCPTRTSSPTRSSTSPRAVPAAPGSSWASTTATTTTRRSRCCARRWPSRRVC